MPPQIASMSRIVSGFLAALLLSRVCAQDCTTQCQSYGLDFENGGSYFQNVLSTANFTALEDFSGCQDDVADNILVDSEGNEYYCNTTPMTPDDTPQQITCPITQNELTSGEWSIIILSNNGDCEPIDYIRSFSLSVGTQVTETVPLTVTITSITGPVSTDITSATETVTATAPTQTTTVSGAYAKTRTVTPLASLTIVTRGVIESTSTTIVASIVSTSTVTPACENAALATAAGLASKVEDVVNSVIAVTIPVPHATSTAAALPTRKRDSLPLARRRSGERRRAILQPQAAEPRERREAIEKRFPDAPTVTVQNSAAGISTATVVQTAPLSIVTVVSYSLTTTTSTPVVTDDSNAQKTLTVTAPAPTLSVTFWIPFAVTTSTQTQDVTATVTAPC